MKTPPRLLNSALGLFFRLLYHELAWAYDFVAWAVSLGRWTGWTQAVLPWLKGERLLEVGFGTGRLQAILWQQGFAPVGLDASRQMCRITARRLMGAKVTSSDSPGKLVNSRAQELPFANRSYDQIVCTFPPEFIFQAETLTEFFRVLTPGGKVVILPLAWIEGKGILDRLAAWLFRITGEAPSRNPALEKLFVDSLRQAGFGVSLEYVEQPSSRLMLVTGEKGMEIPETGQ